MIFSTLNQHPGDFPKVVMNSVFLFWKPGQPRSGLSMTYIAIWHISQLFEEPPFLLILARSLSVNVIQSPLLPFNDIHLFLFSTPKLQEGGSQAVEVPKGASCGLWWRRRLPRLWKYRGRSAVAKVRGVVPCGLEGDGDKKGHREADLAIELVLQAVKLCHKYWSSLRCWDGL